MVVAIQNSFYDEFPPYQFSLKPDEKKKEVDNFHLWAVWDGQSSRSKFDDKIKLILLLVLVGQVSRLKKNAFHN